MKLNKHIFFSSPPPTPHPGEMTIGNKNEDKRIKIIISCVIFCCFNCGSESNNLIS